MSKKALCVGINDYPYDGSDLNGCVNDAMAWADKLFLLENVGLALLAARNRVMRDLGDVGDLTGFSAIL